ncbi:MAG: PD40 domain-containing protein, partial [Saprospiraceae bacterium]|nr:PD40 domain-containing protein [Saprospiraceae bacterium]
MKMQQQIHQRATWVIALTCFLTWPALSQFSMNQYDIWVYNPRTGSNIKWATLNGTGEFNPAWSPNGKLMAFDV